MENFFQTRKDKVRSVFKAGDYRIDPRTFQSFGLESDLAGHIKCQISAANILPTPVECSPLLLILKQEWEEKYLCPIQIIYDLKICYTLCSTSVIKQLNEKPVKELAELQKTYLEKVKSHEIELETRLGTIYEVVSKNKDKFQEGIQRFLIELENYTIQYINDLETYIYYYIGFNENDLPLNRILTKKNDSLNINNISNKNDFFKMVSDFFELKNILINERLEKQVAEYKKKDYFKQLTCYKRENMYRGVIPGKLVEKYFHFLDYDDFLKK